MGRNIPIKNKKDPKAVKSNGISLSGRTNCMGSKLDGFGGILDLIVKLAITSRTRIRNAEMPGFALAGPGL